MIKEGAQAGMQMLLAGPFLLWALSVRVAVWVVWQMDVAMDRAERRADEAVEAMAAALDYLGRKTGAW